MAASVGSARSSLVPFEDCRGVVLQLCCITLPLCYNSPSYAVSFTKWKFTPDNTNCRS